eukprot:NODE_1178_length_1538_cov_465.484889_g977_i0.p2 GENE.NODE_1178_length_1538_cov_465.484889_g977_i0~~NODE_1178_length_1538_cov_465.484889_g977_i0.p2  ORF type:complete len:424 (+),score=176.50 NODE_1178_length_1538_cov_465.484889_g977_i0:157-1428(+)
MATKAPPPASVPDEVEDDVEEAGEEGEEEEEEEDTTLNNPDVVEKYKCASRFANQVLAHLVEKSVAGAKVADLCAEGDAMIEKLTSTVYKKKKGASSDKPMEKGISSPTCVNVNNLVCHYSPDTSDAMSLSDGDVVRIDLGAHIDGFAAVAATTLVVGGEDKLQSILQPKADAVMTAAHVLQDLCLRAFRPGNCNHQITEIIQAVCALYEVSACEGVLSHRLGKNELDGLQSIIQRRILKDGAPQKVEQVDFEVGQAWMFDIVLSSGTGRLRPGDAKTFVFKRSSNQFQLRMKSAREVLHQIGEKFHSFPFSVRALDEKRGRFGISECLKHDLISPYPVLYEKGGEVVCQLKSTVLITSNSVERVAYVPSPFANKTEKPLPEPLAAVMARSLSINTKKKKKKAKAKAAKDEPAEEKPAAKSEN